MDENTTRIIKERFDALPESIKEIILSSNYEETLIEIGKKYQLNIEQMGILEVETTMTMMGLTPTKDFETELVHELNIDKIKGNQIVTEINEKIFIKIRELLKLMNTREGEEPSIEEEPEKIFPESDLKENIEKNIESREKMLEEIENVDLKAQKELPAPEKTINNYELRMTNENKSITNDELRITNKEKTSSILERKLSGSFKIPGSETNHSLSNITRGSGEEKTKLPKVDPYRELPE